MRATNELEPDQITLEHIASQSKGNLVLSVGSIGNLLPLGQAINQLADTDNFHLKIEHYKKSELALVKEFVEKYKAKQEWIEEDVVQRINDIALLAYENIWTI